MAKGFGIAALIAAVLGAFVPLVGFWIGVFALLLATFAALAGDRVFSIATLCVSIVVFVFLTPSLLLTLGLLAIVAVVALCLPVLAIILNATGKMALDSGKRDPDSGGTNS